MPAPPLLQASSITKSYAGLKALSHVSFELHAAEVHALIGENGAGKSTLIKIITGAVSPDSGTLTVRTARAAQFAYGLKSPRYRRDLSTALVIPTFDRRGKHCT